MSKAVQTFPTMCRFQLRLKVMTEKAVGVQFENDTEDDPIEWLPLSEIVIHNDWKHDGKHWLSGKMPVWLGRKIGLASAFDR